jgi:hypothetical protein
MIVRYFVLMIWAVALAACGRDGSAAALNTPIQLAPGQSAVFDAADLQIQLVGIDSDSRCPSDVTCVWAGEVVVRLALRKDSRTREVAIKGNENLPVEGFAVSVLEVLPPRSSSQPIAPADYRVTLKVTQQSQ